jgi:hypothetical protein
VADQSAALARSNREASSSGHRKSNPCIIIGGRPKSFVKLMINY